MTPAITVNAESRQISVTYQPATDVSTNLGVTRTTTTVVVTSSTGDDATIPAADASAGIMTAAMKSKLDGIASSADVTRTALTGAGTETSFSGSDYLFFDNGTALKKISGTNLQAQIQSTAYTPIYIGAESMNTQSSDGAQATTAVNGLLTTNIERKVMAYDQSTPESALAWFTIPTGWNTFTAKLFLSSFSSGDAVFSVSSAAWADGDAISLAVGSSATNTITIAANNYKFATTSAITPSGNVAAGNRCMVRVTRDANNGSDNLAGDVFLEGILLTRVS